VARKSTTKEQDLAAGGENFRKVMLPDGSVATASVSVQMFARGKQQWGYLRFKVDSKTIRCYIGKVSAETLEQSLAIGWRLVREKRTLERSGWSWMEPTVRQ